MDITPESKPEIKPEIKTKVCRSCKKEYQGKYARCDTCRAKFADVLIMFMTIMVCLIGYMYLQETKDCREYATKMRNPLTCDAQCDLIRQTYSDSRWTDYNLTSNLSLGNFTVNTSI
jgi:hypothetical protein